MTVVRRRPESSYRTVCPQITYLKMWVLILIFFGLYSVVKLMRTLHIGNYGSRYVLVTGCDSGFGNMLVKKLDIMGFNVFAACFTTAGALELKQVCTDRVLTLQLDVRRDDSIQSALGLWGLVNNAGIAGSVGWSDWLKKQDYVDCLDINLFGLIEVTNAFLPLVRKGNGRVVNTASILGRITAGSAPYVISKYGVEAYSDCLRREQYKSHVSVHIVEPGFFRTTITDPHAVRDSLDTSFKKASRDVQEYYGNVFLKKVLDHAKKTLDVLASPDVHQVVDAYTHALTARFPKTRYVVGWDGNYFFRPLWNLPTCLSDLILGYGYPTPKEVHRR
ncbi:hypothetical protein ScPMuIL_015717 [Solemya velum]